MMAFLNDMACTQANPDDSTIFATWSITYFTSNKAIFAVASFVQLFMRLKLEHQYFYSGPHHGLFGTVYQTIIWTNTGIWFIRPLGTNFSKNLIRIQTFSLKKMYLKMSSAKWRPFCLGLNVSKSYPHDYFSFNSLRILKERQWCV